MSVIDKYGILQNLSRRSPVVLELGCGSKKKREDSIGVDAIDYMGVDIVGDVFDVLKEIPDGVVDAITSHHFLEHNLDLEALIQESARVIRIGGRFEAVVPHFSNPYFYSDPTHRNYFGLYTFSYFSRDGKLRRKVPTYNKVLAFELREIDLFFKSSPPFYLRYGIKWFIGKIFNSCRFIQEFYEENLCYIIPCYEIRYLLERIPSVKERGL